MDRLELEEPIDPQKPSENLFIKYSTQAAIVILALVALCIILVFVNMFKLNEVKELLRKYQL